MRAGEIQTAKQTGCLNILEAHGSRPRVHQATTLLSKPCSANTH